MDEELLARARELARAKGKTFDQMVIDLIASELGRVRGTKTRAMFELADRLRKVSADGPLTRDEAHERKQ